jgi:hypothetical protein
MTAVPRLGAGLCCIRSLFLNDGEPWPVDGAFMDHQAAGASQCGETAAVRCRCPSFRQVYLGGYELEEAAAEAYDMAALKCKGPGCLTNFPPGRYSDLLSSLHGITLEELIMAVRRQSQVRPSGEGPLEGGPAGWWWGCAADMCTAMLSCQHESFCCFNVVDLKVDDLLFPQTTQRPRGAAFALPHAMTAVVGLTPSTGWKRCLPADVSQFSCWH